VLALDRSAGIGLQASRRMLRLSNGALEMLLRLVYAGFLVATRLDLFQEVWAGVSRWQVVYGLG
jgi:hypothetical protein